MTIPARPAADRLSTPVIFAFASAGIPGAMLMLILGTYLPRFYAGHLGIALTAVAGAIATVRLIDIGFDLVIGYFMDKTRTRFGRYRVWYAAGMPILWLAIYKVLNPPADAGTGYLIVWLLVIYTGTSITALSHAAWAAALATGYNERSRVYGWMQGVGVLGSVSLLLTPIFTNGAIQPGKGESMAAIGWIIISLMPFTAAASIFFAPEKIAPKSHETVAKLKDYIKVFTTPGMARLVIADLFLVLGPGTTGPIYIFFFHDAKGFAIKEVSLLLIPYIGAGLVGAPFWAAIAQKLGKHRTVQVACVCYAITQTVLMAMPKGAFAMTALGMFSVGFCASAFVLLIRAMVADISDQIRLETGQNQTGLLYALVTITQKFGSSITVAIVFPILAAVGYNAREDAVNTEAAIRGLEMCYLFAPIALVLVGGAMFFGYKLDKDRHADIRAQLDSRDAALTEELESEPLSGMGTGPAGGTVPVR
ncbi:MAG TPA: MFS transporter [Phenylobacterium sp.]|nr:MFS transporter [Phenylobacterium sp.]